MSGKNIQKLGEKYKDYMVEMRRYFHENPEPSTEEYNTSAKIKEELDKMGIPYVSAAGTGVIGTIQGGKPGKTVALRADMDALQVKECTGLPFASKKEGLMHACGHDGHIASLLGAAKILNEIKDEIQGTVKLFFQPAEETAWGAKKMIEEGALEGVDGVFGIHIWADIELGKISVEAGPRMASTDLFRIKVTGKGGHGSLPHQGVDAVVAGSAIVMNLQSIVSREISPLETAVVSVGQIKSGSRFNVIAPEAFMDGTTRAFSAEVRGKFHGMIDRIAKNTAAAYRAEAVTEYEYLVPVTINDERCSKIAEEAVRETFGEEALTTFPKITGSEDFSYFSNEREGVLCFVGTGTENYYPHHHPKFSVDERALPVAASMYAAYAVNYLKK